MKKVIFVLKSFIKGINYIIVNMALAMVYVVFMLYHPFFKSNQSRWITNVKDRNNELKQTEYPW